jgi:hypothetical protein
VALDPGGTTGYAIVDDSRIKDFGQLGGEHHMPLYNDLTYIWKPDLVICERFVHRQTLGVDQTALEYIGVVKLFCQATETELIMQTAAIAKGFWTDAKLRKTGLWMTNQRHAMDAVRHALVWITDRDDYYIRKLA